MPETEIAQSLQGTFHLDKWFLDFVGTNGEAMIFYAAKLHWNGWTVAYASWLQYDPESGVNQTSGFRRVQMPVAQGDVITWSDDKFGVSGEWKSIAQPVGARLLEDATGAVDWHCHHPASKVVLHLGGKIMEGTGYVEQLVLTTPPWKIPMHELRWGRFIAPNVAMVWIEWRTESRRQWLWLNGEQIESAEIEDDFIAIPGLELRLALDRGVELEAEKKISSVVEKLIRFLPGVNKIIPLKFLLADECKWLSKGILLRHDAAVAAHGSAIHERVNFNTHST